MTLIAAGFLIVCGLFAVSATPARYELNFRSANNCRRCASLEECYLPPAAGCAYGQFKDNCGYVNCVRGPGEVCSHSKRCVDGTICLCGKCTGCYFETPEDEPECYIHPAACTNNYV